MPLRSPPRRPPPGVAAALFAAALQPPASDGAVAAGGGFQGLKRKVWSWMGHCGLRLFSSSTTLEGWTPPSLDIVSADSYSICRRWFEAHVHAYASVEVAEGVQK